MRTLARGTRGNLHRPRTKQTSEKRTLPAERRHVRMRVSGLGRRSPENHLQNTRGKRPRARGKTRKTQNYRRKNPCFLLVMNKKASRQKERRLRRRGHLGPAAAFPSGDFHWFSLLTDPRVRLCPPPAGGMLWARKRHLNECKC